jgi:DNA-binding Lrp family transcriptional regulator
MKSALTPFEKRLLNILQTGLPVVDLPRRRPRVEAGRPYARIAGDLKVAERRVLLATRRLAKRGFIRRIGAIINWRAIGQASTLVAAAIPDNKLKRVVAAVNKLDGVSHNYLREAHYNLWFTLRADSQRRINEILAKLKKRFGLDFHSLPVRRTFKLDVRFDAQSAGRRLLATRLRRIKSRQVNMDKIDKKILKKLQGGLKIVKRPFDFLLLPHLSIEEVLSRLSAMLKKGIIYRIGAVVNHHKLGFTANAMFVCKVSRTKVVDLGPKLSKLNIVSHCYQRKQFPGWDYNLYAMLHGRRQTDIQQSAERFVKSQGLKKWALLKTKKTLKK